MGENSKKRQEIEQFITYKGKEKPVCPFGKGMKYLYGVGKTLLQDKTALKNFVSAMWDNQSHCVVIELETFSDPKKQRAFSVRVEEALAMETRIFYEVKELGAHEPTSRSKMQIAFKLNRQRLEKREKRDFRFPILAFHNNCAYDSTYMGPDVDLPVGKYRKAPHPFLLYIPFALIKEAQEKNPEVLARHRQLIKDGLGGVAYGPDHTYVDKTTRLYKELPALNAEEFQREMQEELDSLYMEYLADRLRRK